MLQIKSNKGETEKETFCLTFRFIISISFYNQHLIFFVCLFEVYTPIICEFVNFPHISMSVLDRKNHPGGSLMQNSAPGCQKHLGNSAERF